MPQVSVGFVPVCTIVGKAEIQPEGNAGNISSVFVPPGLVFLLLLVPAVLPLVLFLRFASQGVDAIVHIVMTAADVAAHWLIFMAGCKGGVLGKTLPSGTSKAGLLLRETSGPVRARACNGFRVFHAYSGQNPDPGRLRNH